MGHDAVALWIRVLLSKMREIFRFFIFILTSAELNPRSFAAHEHNAADGR